MNRLKMHLVKEVTGDKSLPKLARMNKQIENAHHASSKAQLVKLVEKNFLVLEISHLI